MRSVLVLVPIACLALIACTTADNTGVDMKALWQERFEEIWNKGNVATVDKWYAANFVRHNPASWQLAEIKGIDAFKEYVLSVRETFPDFHIETHNVLIDRHLTAANWTISGTHRDTGMKMSVDGISMNRMVGGKITEEWIAWDTKSLLDQIGVNADEATTMK